jgi:hypothetical protein
MAANAIPDFGQIRIRGEQLIDAVTTDIGVGD